MGKKLKIVVTYEIIGDEKIFITEQVGKHIDNIVINLRDEAVRNSMISLGWTPPSS